jgi:hypothetical protein
MEIILIQRQGKGISPEAPPDVVSLDWVRKTGFNILMEITLKTVCPRTYAF